MLTKDQIKFYHDNGYLLVPGMLSTEEAAFYRKECHGLADRLSATRNIDATWGRARENEENRLCRWIG